MWQDAVFSIGTAIFILALIPTVLGPNKPEASTCLLTGVILLGFSITHMTLGLWIASAVAFLNAVVWFVLLAQTKSIDKAV